MSVHECAQSPAAAWRLCCNDKAQNKWLGARRGGERRARAAVGRYTGWAVGWGEGAEAAAVRGAAAAAAASSPRLRRTLREKEPICDPPPAADQCSTLSRCLHIGNILMQNLLRQPQASIDNGSLSTTMKFSPIHELGNESLRG